MTQQTLREKINGVFKQMDENEYFDFDVAREEIIQQVIEWVDKEVIGEDENPIVRPYGFNDSSLTNIDYRKSHKNELRASQRQKLQQLKENL